MRNMLCAESEGHISGSGSYSTCYAHEEEGSGEYEHTGENLGRHSRVRFGSLPVYLLTEPTMEIYTAYMSLRQAWNTHGWHSAVDRGQIEATSSAAAENRLSLLDETQRIEEKQLIDTQKYNKKEETPHNIQQIVYRKYYDNTDEVEVVLGSSGQERHVGFASRTLLISSMQLGASVCVTAISKPRKMQVGIRNDPLIQRSRRIMRSWDS